MAYQYWLGELEYLADTTRRNYVHYFELFINWLEVDAEELYQWQKRLLDDGDPRSNRGVVLKFREWSEVMINSRDWTGSTVLKASYGIRSFFTANSILFPLRKQDIPRFTEVGARVVLLDEVRVLVERIAGEHRVRNRALLMVLKETGLRRSDVSNLNVEDYLGAKVIKTDSGVFRVIDEYRTQKTGELAWVHIGPEACEAVDLYLGERKTGALFLNRKGIRMYEGILTTTIIRCAHRHLERPEHISPHSFRKFHRTALEAKMPESYVKKLQGKATDPYIHPEQTGELTEAYIKHYDAIRIFREAQELDDMKQQNVQLGSEVDDLRADVRRLESDMVLIRGMRDALDKKKKVNGTVYDTLKP
jgi:integrase